MRRTNLDTRRNLLGRGQNKDKRRKRNAAKIYLIPEQINCGTIIKGKIERSANSYGRKNVAEVEKKWTDGGH